MSLPLLHAGRTNPGLSAQLDLRFALDKSLTAYRGPTPSFSRASTGSYFDGSGVLRYAALNINLYSEQFENAVYTKSQGAISANQTTAPDGAITADKFTASAGTVNPNVYQAVTTTSASVYTFSIFVKKNTHDFVQIVLNGVANGYANFDIANGAVGTVGAGGSATASIINSGSGWYRCVITYTTASTTGNGYINLIGSSTAGRGATFVAAGTESVYLWGQQLELSSTVGTYCPTTSSANSAPRFDHTYNGTSWVSRGLLVEAQGTNLTTHSSDLSHADWGKFDASITTDQAIAPDNTNTADFIKEGTGNVYKVASPYYAVSAGKYTFSAYLKAGTRTFAALSLRVNNAASGASGTFDLTNGTFIRQVNDGSPTGFSYTITNVGNGWYRYSVSLDHTSGNVYAYIALSDASFPSNGYGITLPYYVGDGTSGIYAWGAQFESGAFPTSYIGTTNSSVVRSADVCQITGSDFSGFWNGTEGSVVAEADFIGVESANDRYIFSASNTTTPSNTFVSAGSNVNSSGNFGSNGYISGAEQFAFSNSANPSANSPFKYALAIKQNDFASTYNGSSVLSDTSGNVTSVQVFSIGMLHNFGRQFCGHIARLRYYNKRLPNATLQQLSDPDPTLNLQFALNKTLTPVAGPAPSFSRASTGSYFDSTGTLRYANVNLITYSEQFDNAAWTVNGLNAGVSVNLINAPDGAQTADKLFETNVNGGHYLNQTSSITTGNPYTFTIYVKKENRSWIQIAYNSAAFGVNAWANFDVNNGVVGNKGSSATANITSVGNGWYRCSITATSTATATSGPVICLLDTDANSRLPSYLGDGSSGIYIWGAQLEVSSSPTQYAKTEASTTAGPRFDHVYSGGQWVSRGLLLEEQRTNLLIGSDDFDTNWQKNGAGGITVTTNTNVAPDGTTTADTVAAIPVTGGAEIRRTIAVAAGLCTFSVFIKKTVGATVFPLIYCYHPSAGDFGIFVNTNTGQIVNYAGVVTGKSTTDCESYWRISLSGNISASVGLGIYIYPSATNDMANFNPSLAASQVFWGAQLEQGAFPTSYIGTTSSSVVRSADVCQITGTSFGWMWNQGEGSFSFEADALNPNSVASGQTVYSFDDGSSANSIYALRSGNTAGSDYLVLSYTSGVEKVNFSNPAGTWLVNVPFKNAIGFKLNDFAQSNNGGAVATDTNCTMPIGVNQLSIGRLSYAGYPINGHIAKLLYYPARLTNTKLQQLST